MRAFISSNLLHQTATKRICKGKTIKKYKLKKIKHCSSLDKSKICIKQKKALEDYIFPSKYSPKIKKTLDFESIFLDLLSKYMFSMKDYFNIQIQIPTIQKISRDDNEIHEKLWNQILDCIFKSYLKGKSLCYFTQSQREDYPKIFHKIHNRKKFPKKKTQSEINAINNEKENLFQYWLSNDISEFEEENISGTDCSSQISYDE